jgi:SOS-response transcriptional repressor LexA
MARGNNTSYEDAVVLAVDVWHKHEGYPPTVRDIMDLTGIPSTSTTHRVLRRLADAKKIELRGPHHRPYPWNYR